jgi:hypothetical protein
MSKGCARNSKKGCGGRAAGQAVRIDEFSAAGLLKFIAAVRLYRPWRHYARHSAEDGAIYARAVARFNRPLICPHRPDLPHSKSRLRDT